MTICGVVWFFCPLQILVRYDITLIQEIRDLTGTAIHELLADVNRFVTSASCIKQRASSICSLQTLQLSQNTDGNSSNKTRLVSHNSSTKCCLLTLTVVRANVTKCGNVQYPRKVIVMPIHFDMSLLYPSALLIIIICNICFCQFAV